MAWTATPLEAAPVRPPEVVREVTGVSSAAFVSPVDNLGSRLRAPLGGLRNRFTTARLVGEFRTPEELEK